MAMAPNMFKISKKDFAALLGCDISDIVYDNIRLSFYEKDEEGNVIMVGPSFARKPKIIERVLPLVTPGRPEGTTIANGAAPKSPRKKLEDQ